MIPNFVTDRLPANELALYVQIKRRAGDSKEGLFFGSEKLLKDKLKIGSKALKKALQSLIEQHLITFSGKKNTSTNGGPQSVNAYRINDIWEINKNFYTKGVAKRTPPGGLRAVQKNKKDCALGQQRIPIEENKMSEEKWQKIKKEMRETLGLPSTPP